MKNTNTNKGYVLYCYKSNQHFWCTSSLFIRSFEKLIEEDITFSEAIDKYPDVAAESGLEFSIPIEV